MTTAQDHPSFFALDRHALGVEESRLVHEHVAGCETCRGHVERLHGVGRPLPAWARELGERRPSRGRWFRWLAIATPAVAAAAVAVLVAWPRTPAAEIYDTARGGPAVGVYVRRGATVTLWDGEAQIHAGDQLRLKVVPEGHSRLAVYTLSPSRDLQELYRAAVDGEKDHMVPKAWTVDEAPGAEVLVIVLSDREVATSAIERALEHGAESGGGTWVRKITLPKRARGEIAR